MSARLAVLALFALASVSTADDKRTLTVSTSRALPKIESVSVYKAGAAIAGKEKAKPVLTAKFGEAITLPDDGPFDVYVKPAGQQNVLAAAKLSVKEGKSHEIKLGDLFGTVQVFQNDDSPRLGKIIITSQDDPGPDEKGHVAIQVGTEYREELVVPDGVYAVWLVSGNGARGQRIADRIRVLAGKNVRLGD